MSAEQWTQPTAIDDVTLAFPARVVGVLLPDKADIPAEFWNRDTAWGQLVSRWFFEGLRGSFIAKDGIDRATALRHLKAVMGSYEPKHEHKEAGAAYLMSLWFDRFEEAATVTP